MQKDPSLKEFQEKTKKKKGRLQSSICQERNVIGQSIRMRVFVIEKGEAARFQSIITGSVDVIDGRALRRSDFPFPVAIGHVPATDQPSRSIDTKLSLSRAGTLAIKARESCASRSRKRNKCVTSIINVLLIIVALPLVCERFLRRLLYCCCYYH